MNNKFMHNVGYEEKYGTIVLIIYNDKQQWYNILKAKKMFAFISNI